MAARKPRARTSTRRRSSSGGGGGSRSAALTPQQKRYAAYKKKHGIKGELSVEQRRAARGHRPDEHRTRAARAAAAGKLTEKQRAAITRYFRAQEKAGRLDGRRADLSDLMSWAEDKGFAAFEAARELRDDLRKRGRSAFRVRVRKGVAHVYGDSRGHADNLSRMEAFVERYGLPDIAWIYYG